jgi:hypothetical protein
MSPPGQSLQTRTAKTRGITAMERWGYAVWFFVAIVFAIPEAWAGFGSPPWPTLSITVAHLESLFPGTRVIIVALIVLLIFQAVRYPFRAGASRPPPGRTPGGRRIRGHGQASPVPALAYLLVALAAVAGGSLITASLTSDMYVLGYVIYSLFAIFFVAIPNALAFWIARDVPFPTFFRTMGDLEQRWRLVAVVVVWALVILALHLVFFPWPNIGV